MAAALTVAPPADAAALADAAYAAVVADPHRAEALAREALAIAHTERDAGAESAARRALGLAAIELDRAPVAITHLEAAVRAGRRATDPQREANARTSLALALVGLGSGRRALAQAHAAVALPGVDDRGPVHLGRALVLERLGRLDDALADYRSALAAFRRAGDRNCEARALCDRGVLQIYRGELTSAEADLRLAETLCRDLGLDLMAASVRQNLGYVAAQRGDVPAALADYEQVRSTFAAVGGTRYAVLESDRCQLLLAAGLVDEARGSADRAISALERTDMGAELAEARLLRAEVALAEADWATAATTAQAALRAFAAQRRPNWTALARSVAVHAAWRADGAAGGAALLRSARRAAEELDAHGWTTRAAEARLLAAEIAIALDRPDVAAVELAVAGRARLHGAAPARVTGWHAEALRCELDGDMAAARRAVSRGLQVLDDHRATLGATELRAHAAARADGLARLGVRYALAAGRPAGVLAAVERARARAGELTPVRPPPDAELAASLGELRGVTALTEQEARDGRPIAHLVRRQAALERAIRRRVLMLPGTNAGAAGARPTLAALRAALGERALVEFFRLDGALHAVTVTPSSCRLVAVGEADAVERGLEQLHHALRRLASPVAGAAGSLHRETAAEVALALQQQLLDPLAATIGDRELVIVPTGALHALPWAALPALADRPLSVSPSATAWLRAMGRADGAGARSHALLAAGPGLRFADDEVRRLAALYPDAECLSGDAATVAAVSAALQRCDRLHLACHGHFRADNALFSSLRLADGPLTVHDLERLASVPAQIILSSCDSGRAVVRAGDELMGLSSALLALGARTIVASAIPVPDDRVTPLMAELHRRLEAGERPARALAAARAALDDADVVTRAAFVCLGAG